MIKSESVKQNLYYSTLKIHIIVLKSPLISSILFALKTKWTSLLSKACTLYILWKLRKSTSLNLFAFFLQCFFSHIIPLWSIYSHISMQASLKKKQSRKFLFFVWKLYSTIVLQVVEFSRGVYKIEIYLPTNQHN